MYLSNNQDYKDNKLEFISIVGDTTSRGLKGRKERGNTRGYRCNRCSRMYLGDEWNRECPFCGGYGSDEEVDAYRCYSCGKTYCGNDWNRQCPFCMSSGDKVDVRAFRCFSCNKIFPGDDWNRQCPFCGGSGSEI